MSQLEKPKFREPCNQCGLCCRLELCELAEMFFAGAQAPCPALEWEDGKTWCGMVRHPSRHLSMPFNGDVVLKPLIEKYLVFGLGCGMPDEEIPNAEIR